MRKRLSTLLPVVVMVLLLVGCLNNDEEAPATAVPAEGQPITEEEPVAEEGSTTGEEAPAAEEQPAEPAEEEAPAEEPVDESVSEEGGAVVVETTAVSTELLPDIVYIDPPSGSSGYTPGSTVQHIVMYGDWLHQIARCYGTSYASVRYANPYIHPDWIYPGNHITVPHIGSVGPIIGAPCVQQYVVQPGDTWYSLAQTFGSQPIILQKANPGYLRVGDVIWVPTTPRAGTPPAISHDLHFILDGDLAIWQSSDGRVARYADDAIEILDIATNAAGDLVLARQTRDGNATTEIALLDLAAGNMTVVESGLPADVGGENNMQWEQLLISPDGAWGVYALPGNNGYKVTTFATNNPAALNSIDGIDHGGNDFFDPQLFPGNDDAHFLWLDGGGIYRLDYALSAGEDPVYEITQPDGIQGFTAEAWSPAGRYLLLLAGFIEGGAFHVLDQDTGSLAQLPDSTGYVTVASASWQDDGTAVVLTPPDGSTGVAYAVYTPQTASDGTLTLVESDTAVLSGVPQDAGVGYAIDASAVQGDASRTVMTIQSSTAAGNGLYALPDGTTTADKLNSIPVSFFGDQWVPDGSGVLIKGSGSAGPSGDVLYVSDADETPFSLADWLGQAIGDFHWTTP